MSDEQNELQIDLGHSAFSGDEKFIEGSTIRQHRILVGKPHLMVVTINNAGKGFYPEVRPIILFDRRHHHQYIHTSLRRQLSSILNIQTIKLTSVLEV